MTTEIGLPDEDVYTADNEEAHGGKRYPCIPVVVEGVASVRQVSLVAGASLTRTFDQGVAGVLVQQDPRRARAVILCTAGTVEVGYGQNEVGSGVAGRITTTSPPLELRASDPIWCAGVGGAATVSVWTETWSI